MPSAAAAKLEKQASTEALDPIKQAIVIIEHKIRNLEKRKRRIESYREEQKNGKELNGDQLNSVSKFDGIILTLDFARELSKQFNGISVDAAKQQKKQARREAQERAQQEIAKVKEILLIQDVLQNIGTETAREDFLQGRNGASQLTEDDLKFLDDIYLEVFPKRGNEEGLPPFADQVQTSAEHLLSIVDGKPKEVVGTTYNKLKELILSIHGCGYFDQNIETTDDTVEEVVAVVPVPVVAAGAEELGEEEEAFLVESQTVVPSDANQPFPQGPGIAPVPSQPQGPPPPAPQTAVLPTPSVNTPAPQAVPAPVASQPQAMVPAPMAPVPTPVAAVESSFFSTAAPAFVPTAQPAMAAQSRPLNEVIGSVSGNFNFLQDSELDSPDMSVMLSGAPGQSTAQHVVPTTPQTNPVTVPSIPTQTFTNQNFVPVPAAAVQPKVVFQPPADMSHHIPGFATATPNPPPPIPMPPGHQVPPPNAGAQRQVAVHQMQPAVSQPAPPPMTQHRPPMAPAASYVTPAASVPSHTYATQAQQHVPQPPQQQPQQVPVPQPPPVQMGQPAQVQPVQAPVATPVQPQVSQQQQQQQPAQAPLVPAQPVQSLPSAGFAQVHKPTEAHDVAQPEVPATTGNEEGEDWVSGEVSQGGDWSTQTETAAEDWSSSNEWANAPNDGYIMQMGNRNYGGRGRGPRGGRGSSNGYPGRGRGNYQNGRGSSGGGGYYRNDERSNNYYQNGYQRDNFNSNGGYKRGGRGGGGVPRGGMERGGGNSRGGMDRGGMRPAGGRGGGGNNPRGNRTGNYSRGGGVGNKQQ